MATAEPFQQSTSFVTHCRQIVSRGYYKVQSVMPALKAFREYIQVGTVLDPSARATARLFAPYCSIEKNSLEQAGFNLTEGSHMLYCCTGTRQLGWSSRHYSSE